MEHLRSEAESILEDLHAAVKLVEGMNSGPLHPEGAPDLRAQWHAWIRLDDGDHVEGVADQGEGWDADCCIAWTGFAGRLDPAWSWSRIALTRPGEASTTCATCRAVARPADFSVKTTSAAFRRLGESPVRYRVELAAGASRIEDLG